MKVNQRGEVIYSSFEELAEAFKIKPVSKVTKDKAKLKKQQERFMERRTCRACHEPMTYIGDNVCVCQNPKCKGIKIERNNDDGTKFISYVPSYSLLDEKGAEIAANLFSAKA